jgi:hypothetical protein
MARRNPREARILGLWSAAWLAVLLVVGLVRLGDLTVQWPVLVVPVLWALLALRRRPDPAPRDDGPPRDVGREPPLGGRTDTVERPAVRPRRERPDRGR